MRAAQTMLARINPHKNDGDIVFKASSHEYTVKGCPPTTSVTRLVHAQFRAFDADAVIDGMMARPNWPSSQYFGNSKAEIKAQWNSNGAVASAAGTKLHNDIENYYNGVDVINTSPEFAQFIAFDQWRKEQGLVPFRAEWTVYDREHMLAGTIDMCFWDTTSDTIAIYDWKRVKALRRSAFDNQKGVTSACESVPDSNYWHYSMQLGLYKWILERNYGYTVSRTALVVLHPGQEHYEIHLTSPVAKAVDAVLSCRKVG
jgi:ATP-dependent exoDNAse (exonuclease V) beta subunit